MLDIKQIKPKGKKSDKYSINLYKYLKRNPEYNKVFYQAMYPVETEGDKEKHVIKEWEQREFNINKLNINEIYLSCKSEQYIEEEGLLIGKSLNSILRAYRDLYENHALASVIPRKYIDITDLFWDEYIKVGRCIWDRTHNDWLQDDERRFTYLDENNRKCNWCGRKQFKEVKEEIKVEKKVTWV